MSYLYILQIVLQLCSQWIHKNYGNLMYADRIECEGKCSSDSNVASFLMLRGIPGSACPTVSHLRASVDRKVSEGSL